MRAEVPTVCTVRGETVLRAKVTIHLSRPLPSSQIPLQFLYIINGMLDDINFGHSLLPGSSRDVVLEVEVAVINSLDPVPLPGVPPGHSHRDGGRDGVAVHWVVDHSALSSVGRHLGCVESRGGLTAGQDVQTDSTAGVALTNNGQDRKP